MNTEEIVVRGNALFNHTENGKEYKFGIPFIPKSELESFEKASVYLHKSLTITNPSRFEKNVNSRLQHLGKKPLKRLSNEERKNRIRIRNKALDSLLKVSIDKVRYKDHITKDPCDLRYVTYTMMHRTPVKEADLQYNQRITDLLTRGKNKEFSDEKVLDKQTQKDKEELLGHFRNMLKKVEEIDLEELTSKEYTDEELAEHAGEIFTLIKTFTVFDDVPGNLLNHFGIKDSKCETIIQNYSRYWDYAQILNARLACITSFSYDLYAPENEPGFLEVYKEDSHFCPNPRYSDGIQCYKTYMSSLNMGVANTVAEMFRMLGISTEDVSVLNPDEPNDIPMSFHSSVDKANKNGAVTYFCEKENIRLTVNIFSDELPRARAHNKLYELIKQSIVEEPAQVDKPDEVVKPAKVGPFGRIADFFTNLVNHHRPRQEAYEDAMTRYNEYQTKLEAYNKYLDARKKYLDGKDENATKEKLVEKLKDQEAAIDEAFHKYKINSDLEREALRFGFISQIDDSKLQIGNDAEVQNLIKKEMPGLGQLQNQEPKPEVAEKSHDKIIIEDEPIIK